METKCVRQRTVAKPADALVPLVVEMKSPRQIIEPARFSLLELD